MPNIPIGGMRIGMKRDDKSRRPLLTRVNRISGQIQGVARMLEEDRDCAEILNTISAIHSALRGLESTLLEDHVRHCVCDAAKDPKRLESRLTEIVSLYKRRLA